MARASSANFSFGTEDGGVLWPDPDMGLAGPTPGGGGGGSASTSDPTGVFTLPASPTLKDSPVDKSITQFDPQIMDVIKSLLGFGGTQAGRAGDFFGLSLPALQQSTDFMGRVLSGSPVDIARLLGPEIDAISKQYDVARKNIQAESRGGGRDLALAQSRFSQAGDVSRAIGTARGTAATRLAEIGGLAGQLGASTSTIEASNLSNLSNLLATLRSQEIGVRGQDIQSDQARAAMLAQLGVGIGGIIADLIGQIGKKKDSTSGVTINLPGGGGGGGATPPFSGGGGFGYP